MSFPLLYVAFATNALIQNYHPRCQGDAPCWPGILLPIKVPGLRPYCGNGVWVML
jgi:hypothetical protein